MPKRFVREAANRREAKTHLSALAESAAVGEEIDSMKSGRPLATLVPSPGVKSRRVPGQGRGKWKVARDFDAPLPDSMLAAFEGV